MRNGTMTLTEHLNFPKVNKEPRHSRWDDILTELCGNQGMQDKELCKFIAEIERRLNYLESTGHIRFRVSKLHRITTSIHATDVESGLFK